jgi:hypothetical protein
MEVAMEFNIKGIAHGIIHEMKEDNADINELEYYLREAYKSVYSREPSKADSVIAQVRDFIEKNPPQAKQECSEG